MKRARLLLHAVTVCALVYAGTIAILSSVPAHHWLPQDKVLAISAHGCGSSYLYTNAVDQLDAQILPVVFAREWSRGTEHAISQRSCDSIAAAVRAEQPILHAVPQRMLCQDVRRWVRARYHEAGYTAGPPLLIVRGELVGSKGYDAALAEIGLVETDRGLELLTDVSVDPTIPPMQE